MVAELAGEIVGGLVPPGAMLPTEQRLCERFGVSRTVVRDAAAQLERLGLVQVRQGLGTIVRPPSAWNDLDRVLLRVRADLGLIGDLAPDLLEIRRLVEVEVAGLAARRRGEDDLARLNELLARMDACRRDPFAYGDADIAFHEALIAATGNALLLKVMRPVNQVRRIGSILTGAREPAIVEASMAGHRAIFAAVAAGDPACARAAMERHVGQFERDLAAALTEPAAASLAAAGRTG